ncbi:vitamin K epoxide reductase family protein [Ulvibacterium sp.]|uniref:vitamin K epoxide reductase family protein n=1 Tax=Ulvibacterium sp. TaxID=2665914 RepID=UPI003BACA2EC
MDNCLNITKQLLKSLQIDFTQQFLEDAILAHPEHPSMLCISDTLDKYAIENLAVKVNGEKLLELPLPCIVEVSDRGGMFKVLVDLTDNVVSYLDDKGKAVETSKAEFLNRWTGVCLLAEVSENSGEPDIRKKRNEKRTYSILKWACVLLFGVWVLIDPLYSIGYTETALPFVLYFGLKLIGLSVGVLLLWYEVDRYNPTLQKFCSGGKKLNCDSVLRSKHATLFNGRLSLGLLGFSYFFGTLSFLLINGFHQSSLTPLSYLSFATFPVVALSAYYQGFVVKQWCKFCIVVQSVLVLEMATAFFWDLHLVRTELVSLLPLMALLLLPIPVWQWLKPLLNKEKETLLVQRSLKKIKNNPTVLQGLLSKTRKIQNSTEGLGISFTNTTAKFNVVKVCHPYCGPCAKAHPILEELREKGLINLQILFVSGTDKNDPQLKPVRHFLALDDRENSILKALNDWYLSETKDYELFCLKYPMNGELEFQDQKIDSMRQWCDIEQISHTPTIFINGHELPREYSVEDLREVLT